jgi:hypothetical protein
MAYQREKSSPAVVRMSLREERRLEEIMETENAEKQLYGIER